MRVLFGAKEDLSDPNAGRALQSLGQLPGIGDIHVDEAHPHMMFVEFDKERLQRTDIIHRMDRLGLHARSLGC